MLRIKRILVPIDFSAHAEQSLAHARELAATYGAWLGLLHVIEEPTFPAIYGAMIREIYGKVPDVNQEALAALQQLLERAEGPGVETELHAVRGHAESEIIRFAEERDVDLIVMSSHGLTGLEHLLLGSVAEKVARHAQCPVLILKAFGKSLMPEPGE